MRRAVAVVIALMLTACGGAPPAAHIPTRVTGMLTPTIAPTAPIPPPPMVDTLPSSPRQPLNRTIQPTPKASRNDGVVQSYRLNMRAGPDITYPVVSVVRQGERVTLLGRAEGLPWVYVRAQDDTEGWISSAAEFLTVSDPIESLPIRADKLLLPALTSDAIVYAPSIDVRTGPGVGYPIIATYKRGNALRIAGRLNRHPWVYVTWEGNGGWTRALPKDILLSTPLNEYKDIPHTPAYMADNALAGPNEGNCDPAYPTICIPVNVKDLDCGDLPWRQFTAYPPDRHRFDDDHDGVGC